MAKPEVHGAETAAVEDSGGRHGLMHLAIFFATIFWAANIIAGKEALKGFSPLALAQIRVLGATLFFGLIYAFWPRRARLRLTRKQWTYFALMGFTGITVNQVFFIGGLARTTVAHNGLIVALGPVMVLVLACLLRLENLTYLKFAGIVTAFMGVLVLTLDVLPSGGVPLWKGDLIQLIGTSAFAYFTILVKKVTNQFDAVTLNFISFAFGAAFLVPISGPEVLKIHWNTISLTAWIGLAFMVFFGSLVSYLLFAYALTGLAASRVAAFNYLQPIIAIALGMWLLTERLTLKSIFGGTLILLGLYLTETERSEGRQTSRAGSMAV